MTEQRETARAQSWGAGGDRAANRSARKNARFHCTDAAVLRISKAGEAKTLGKLLAIDGERLFGVPYRNRHSVTHYVSIPVVALQFARQWGAKSWVIRFDLEGRCLSFPLANVEAAGLLRASHGSPEWFMPLDAFTPRPWLDWPYVEGPIVNLTPEHVGQADAQLALFSGVS